MYKITYSILALAVLLFAGCQQFEEFNQNPNEPTQVSPDVLLPGAIRKSVNTAVDASFLVGNNAAQLSAKTLRLEVDAYNWNAFPTYWEGWYESLTDVVSFEKLAVESQNGNLEAVAIVLRCWIFANLTNAYGNIPYTEAIDGANNNFTPRYDNQQAIYEDLLSELARANVLLAANSGDISGDILLNGDAVQWRKFANSLRLRLLMYASNSYAEASADFASIVQNEPVMESNADNVALTYTGAFPNEFPLIPLKLGDFDAVAISKSSMDVMQNYGDPRMFRFARPNNDDYSDDESFIGAVNGQGAGCTKDGASRLGPQYYNYPALTSAASLGLPMAQGIIMSYAEVEFLLAEAAAKGWITSGVEDHYKAGIQASMEYYQVDYAPLGWADFDDFYDNSGVAYSEVTDIWEQKWLSLFFTGLEPYFEVRRWYHESGNSFSGIPFMEASCGNLNNDMLPLRFLYPGEEESLNKANYDAAVTALGGSDDQNVAMWLVE